MSVVDDLRRAFDASFAAEPRRESIETDHLLAVRVGGEPFALSIRVPAADVRPSPRKHAAHLVRGGGVVRAIVSVESVVRAIKLYSYTFWRECECAAD